MKKFNLLVALLLVVSLASAFAQDEEAAAPTLGGLHGVTGSVSFSFGDDDLKGGDGFAFSSTKDGSTTADVTASVATDAVEAGVTVSLVPTITKTAGDSDKSASATATNIALAQDALAWYLDNNDTDDWTIPTPLDEANWEAIIGNADVYTEADGWADDFANDDFNINNEADWEELASIASTVISQIEGEIAALAPTLTGLGYSIGDGWYIDQFGQLVDADDTDEDSVFVEAEEDAANIAVLKAELDAVEAAYSDYFDAVYEASSDDSWAAEYPVSNAYLRLKALFGVVDVEFQVNGKAVAVGSKFTVAEDDANLGVSLGLTSGVVEGLSASVLYTLAESKAAVDEDFETLAVEAEDAEDAVGAVEVNGGYATDMFNVDFELGLVDFDALTTHYSVRGGLSLADLFGLSVGAELTGTADADGNGLGVAADLGASIMGIAPSVDFRLSSNLYDDADTNDEGTALEYFQTVDEDSTYLGLGLSVGTADLIGMNLATVSGGLGLVFGGGNDWNAGVDFTFADFGAPVTAGFTLTSLYDSTLTWKADAGVTVADIAFAAYLGDEAGDNLVYGVSIDYTYDVLGIAAGFTSDKDGVMAIDVTVSTSF